MAVILHFFTVVQITWKRLDVRYLDPADFKKKFFPEFDLKKSYGEGIVVLMVILIKRFLKKDFSLEELFSNNMGENCSVWDSYPVRVPFKIN